jgi:hypothetical protein
LQDKQIAATLNAGINSFEKRNFDLQKELSVETDPDKINAIQTEINANDEKILVLKQGLIEERREVGDGVQISFTVQ